MPSYYRDGRDYVISQARQRATATIAQIENVMRRGGVPRSIRAELAGMARELRLAVHDMTDVTRLDVLIERAASTMKTAEVIVSSHQEQGSRRRRKWALRCLVVIALALPFSAAMIARGTAIFEECGVYNHAPTPNLAALLIPTAPHCIFTEDHHCARQCDAEGLCVASEDGDCVPSDDTHCAASMACRLRGACSYVEGSCMPSQEHHCKDSTLCQTDQLCEFASNWRTSPGGICTVDVDELCAKPCPGVRGCTGDHRVCHLPPY